MANNTVEVPVAWLEKLIQLGKQADVTVTPGVQSIGIRPTVYKSSLIRLKGYIESAEALIGESDGE